MIFFFISLSTYVCYLILKYQMQLSILQNNGYSIKKYIGSIFENSKKIFFTPEILGFIVIALAINTDAKVTGISMVIFYTLMFLYELKYFKREIKFDKNIIRIIIFAVILYAIMFTFFVLNNNYLLSGYFIDDNTWIYYTSVIIVGYLSPFVILLMGLLNNGVMKLFSVKNKNAKKSKKH